ncbi:unnamed protein product [Phytomonas sp. EM1]|nr:unnamed protein product [Phytomonas sp. EM1]|eukprot:CCW61625.1 unnamed protein product [Phytomonas sp. isolate EM1]
MPSHTELRKGCNQVLNRLKKGVDGSVYCILCSLELGDYEALLQHLMLQHAVFCSASENVSDLDGFFNHLKSRLLGQEIDDKGERSEEASEWCCPVCGEELEEPTPAALEDHITTLFHQHWNVKAIPSLAPFCLCASPDSSTSSSSGSERTDADNHEEEWIERNENSSDDNDDFNEPCICLFCPHESMDCLEHMREVHDFDFPAITRARPDLRDEYDLIALINIVRRSVSLKRCPCCGANQDTIEKAKDGVDTACANEKYVEEDFLEKHLRAFPSHRLPSSMETRQDADLVPYLPGDALISLVVTSGEGFLGSEPTDPDFPMVPTLQEVIAARNVRGLKKAC